MIVSSPIYAQTGPGGVGKTDGTSALSAWYRVDNGISTTGSAINSWVNSAGFPSLDLSETGSNRPTLVTNALNGFSEVSFNGSNKLTTIVGGMTTSNFVTDETSSFVVNKADNVTQQSTVFATDPLTTNRFSNHIPWLGIVYFDLGTCCTGRIDIGGMTNLTAYSLWTYDAIGSILGKQVYRNGLLQLTIGSSTTSYTGHATDRFNLGGFSTGMAGYEGDLTEVIVYRQKINNTQRRIVQNYLASKYGLPLSADDFYAQDNSGFFYDVAGIGQGLVDNHTDSRGTGIVRMNDPGVMGIGAYFFWGHNNGALQPQTADVPSGIQARLSRVWASQETDGMNTMDVSFDLTGMGPVTPSDLRLLIDDDGTFASGATAVPGAISDGSNMYRFNNVAQLTNGFSTVRRFTLGTVNAVTTPLPVTWTTVAATVKAASVIISWTTATEMNNAIFGVERSSNGTEWLAVGSLSARGSNNTSTSYKLSDQDPLWGRSYYRIKQTDYDGTSSYSQVVTVNIPMSMKDIEIFPVPADDELIIRFPSAESTSLTVIDEMGRLQLQQDAGGDNQLKLDVSKLSNGIYILGIISGRGEARRRFAVSH